MAQLPETHAAAAGFVAAKSAAAFAFAADLSNWPALFPGWIDRIEPDDERWHATGPRKEKYDLYPTSDAEHFALDVEVVDELGSADVLRLRVLDMPGGALVIVSHGRLSGTSDSAWQQKRDGVKDGLAGLLLDSPA